MTHSLRTVCQGWKSMITISTQSKILITISSKERYQSMISFFGHLIVMKVADCVQTRLVFFPWGLIVIKVADSLYAEKA